MTYTKDKIKNEQTERRRGNFHKNNDLRLKRNLSPLAEKKIMC